MDFQQQYSRYLALIEAKLGDYLNAIKEKNIVSEAMGYSLMVGGKRIRPVLLLAFCDMLGGNLDNALPFACAIEMLHTCSLIHDDLPCMDDDDMRRGKPSCHKQFGEAFALLAGDGLLNFTYETMLHSGGDPSVTVECAKILADAAGINGMISGQTIDLLSENKTIDLNTLKKLHALKTGQMLTAPCKMGVVCAGGTQDDMLNAALFGDCIGLQFQIMDDILDVTGTAEELGKPIGSDAELNKSTYVSLLGLDAAREQAEQLTGQAFEILENYGEKAAFLKQLTQMLAKRKK